jgi:hypothetical protein
VLEHCEPILNYVAVKPFTVNGLSGLTSLKNVTAVIRKIVGFLRD